MLKRIVHLRFTSWFIQPFQGVGRVNPRPMRPREVHIGQHVLLSGCQNLRRLRSAGGHRLHRLRQLLPGRLSIRLGEDRLCGLSVYIHMEAPGDPFCQATILHHIMRHYPLTNQSVKDIQGITGGVSIGPFPNALF